MYTAVLFVLCYGVSLFARRLEEMVDAGDELQRRAMGNRRRFQLLDESPTP